MTQIGTTTYGSLDFAGVTFQHEGKSEQKSNHSKTAPGRLSAKDAERYFPALH